MTTTRSKPDTHENTSALDVLEWYSMEAAVVATAGAACSRTIARWHATEKAALLAPRKTPPQASGLVLDRHAAPIDVFFVWRFVDLVAASTQDHAGAYLAISSWLR